MLSSVEFWLDMCWFLFQLIYYLFSDASYSHADSSPGSSGEIKLSIVTTNSLKEKKVKAKQFLEGTLAQCSNSQDYRSVCSSEFSDDPVMEVDSVVQVQGLNLASNRFVFYGHAGTNNLRPFSFMFLMSLNPFSFLFQCRDASNKKIDTFKMPESTPHGSPVSDSNSLAVTPGSVVWARTTCQLWWPAEVLRLYLSLFFFLFCFCRYLNAYELTCNWSLNNGLEVICQIM